MMKSPVSCHWQVGHLLGPSELLYHEPALVEHVQQSLGLDPEDPHLRRRVRLLLLSGAEIPHLHCHRSISDENHITDIWFDIILNGMARINALDETLDVRYLGVGWSPQAAADADDSLVAEAYRFEVDLLDREGKFKLHMGKFLDPAEGNAQTWTIDSIDAANAVTLTGPNLNLLVPGRRIRLYTGPNPNTDFIHVTISTADTGTGEITFTPAFSPVPSTPYSAHILFSEYGFFSGSGASSGANTGRLLNRLTGDKHKVSGAADIYHATLELVRS